MPLTHVVDEDLQVVFVYASGVLTEREVLELSDALREDGRISPDWTGLADLRAVDEIRVGSSFLRGFPTAMSRTARRAVLVSSSLATGMARMYALSNDLDESLRTFRDLGDALEWVGLSRDSIIPRPTAEDGSRQATA